MTRWSCRAAALAVLFAPMCTGAQGVTLQQAIDSALRNNLDLRIAQSVGDSARSEMRIARALPNPTYSIVPNTPTQFAGTIALDIGPQRVFRVRASDLGARAVSADVADARRLVVFAVEKGFYDVLLADAHRAIVSARRTVVQQLVLADSARVRAGDAPERSLIRSSVELVRSDADMARAAIEAQSTRVMLQALMGIAAPDSALRVEGSLAFRDVSLDSGASVEATLARRPDVSASRTREQQSLAAQQLAASAILPVPQLSYVRQTTSPFESGRFYQLGIGFELPLLNQYRGQRDRAAAGRDAALYTRRRTEEQASRQLRAALSEFHAQQALVRQYETGVVAKLAQNVEATRYAYSRGATSLLEVLDALRAQQDVMTDYTTALHDYWVAVFTLRAAQAEPLHTQ